MLGKGLEAMRPFGGMSEFEMKVDIRSLDCVCVCSVHVCVGGDLCEKVGVRGCQALARGKCLGEGKC